MTIEEAKAIRERLDKDRYEYYDLKVSDTDDRALLDGHFTADELEAFAVLMRAGLT